MDVYGNELDVTATTDTVPAANLDPGTRYELELETFRGDIEVDRTTPNQDDLTVTTLFGDVNKTEFMTVSEVILMLNGVPAGKASSLTTAMFCSG